MQQAILGLKAAMEKAAAGKDGIPDEDATVAAFEGLSFTMVIRQGGEQTANYDVVAYAAACVNPPEGKKSADWIKSGFKGAKCD